MEVITLTSKDGKNFEVSSTWAMKLNTVKNLMEDIGTDQPIPVTEVVSRILENVITCLKSEDEGKMEEMETFFKGMNQSDLFETNLAANYLDYPVLLDLTCKTVADMIRGKTPAEIRTTFNIKNDFTPEEEQNVIKENEWVEEK